MNTPTNAIDDLETDEGGIGEPDPGAEDPGAQDPGVQCDAYQKRVALVGRFGGMNQREAANVLRSYEAIVVDAVTDPIDWVVIGAEEPPIPQDQILGERLRTAAAAGAVEILHETELWQRLGLVDVEQSIRRYHTPAMLAHLLGVSVRVIRRWHRRGLITPVRTLHNLPYFDFQEVATARRLAQWIASGASPQAIEQRLVDLLEVLPDIQRPLDQLSILVEGKQILLRQGEGLLEPGGQLRFDFDALDSTGDDHSSTPENSAIDTPAVLSIWDDSTGSNPDFQVIASERDELLCAAYDSEDDGDLETAIDCYHAILARDGPRAEIHFQLGELLYRINEVIAARERYYSAIELDPDYVEARASLGCVLVETGQIELAVAAFRGALSLYEDYADVHYNLARVLDDTGREVESKHHWQRFLQLSPDSPWAAEARSRIHAIDQT